DPGHTAASAPASRQAQPTAANPASGQPRHLEDVNAFAPTEPLPRPARNPSTPLTPVATMTMMPSPSPTLPVPAPTRIAPGGVLTSRVYAPAVLIGLMVGLTFAGAIVLVRHRAHVLPAPTAVSTAETAPSGAPNLTTAATVTAEPAMPTTAAPTAE